MYSVARFSLLSPISALPILPFGFSSRPARRVGQPPGFTSICNLPPATCLLSPATCFRYQPVKLASLHTAYCTLVIFKDVFFDITGENFVQKRGRVLMIRVEIVGVLVAAGFIGGLSILSNDLLG